MDRRVSLTIEVLDRNGDEHVITAVYYPGRPATREDPPEPDEAEHDSAADLDDNAVIAACRAAYRRD